MMSRQHLLLNFQIILMGHYCIIILWKKNTPETIVNTAITNNINNLSDARMDKINRMVRLQRWLNLPYDQLICF